MKVLVSAVSADRGAFVINAMRPGPYLENVLVGSRHGV